METAKINVFLNDPKIWIKCFQNPYQSLKSIYRRQRTGGLNFRQIMGFLVQIIEGFSKGNSKKAKKSCFLVISSPNSSKNTKVEQVCNPTFFFTCSKTSFPTFKNFKKFHTKKSLSILKTTYIRGWKILLSRFVLRKG